MTEQRESEADSPPEAQAPEFPAPTPEQIEAFRKPGRQLNEVVLDGMVFYANSATRPMRNKFGQTTREGDREKAYRDLVFDCVCWPTREVLTQLLEKKAFLDVGLCDEVVKISGTVQQASSRKI